LEGLYFFHVEATAVGQAVQGTASVTFKNFEIKWSDGKVGIGDYRGLQVSLIPWSKFSEFVDTSNFCSPERELILRARKDVPMFTVSDSQEATFLIEETDAYLLTVTNCGERLGGTFTKGEVIVKQPHGYLPGNKILMLSWWGWFTLINTFLCIMWAVAVARHYKALVYIQKAVAACAMMALLEATLTYFQYKEWNGTGTESMVLNAAAMFAYSFKYAFTLRTLMETAAGSGILMERLEVRLAVKMELVCALFFALQWIWKVVMHYKYRILISPSLLVVMTIPGTLLWFGLFIWVYRKFHTLLSQLQDKKLAAGAVTLFINLRLALVGSILLATVVLLIQFTDIMLSATPWNLQWVPYDAAPHSVYTLFLLALMILWWPNADSWKLGYFNEVRQDEGAAGVVNKRIGFAEAEDGKVQAEQIGVAKAEES